MQVKQMTGRNGRPVANQFTIHTPEGVYFQSYETIIAFKPRLNNEADNRTQLDRDAWDYSRTTSKYRNLFLGETTQSTKKKIKDGTYSLVDLN